MATPNNPISTATHRVCVGCDSAVSIWAARLPRQAGFLVEVVGVDDVRNESGDTDEEQQQRDEEQEQPEGDGAADDRAADLAVTLVDPHARSRRWASPRSDGTARSVTPSCAGRSHRCDRPEARRARRAQYPLSSATIRTCQDGRHMADDVVLEDVSPKTGGGLAECRRGDLRRSRRRRPHPRADRHLGQGHRVRQRQGR